MVSDADAARIAVPVESLVQWDDERVPCDQSLALFDAFAFADETLHTGPGKHSDVPAFELDSTLRFFSRHLARYLPPAVTDAPIRPPGCLAPPCFTGPAGVAQPAAGFSAISRALAR